MYSKRKSQSFLLKKCNNFALGLVRFGYGPYPVKVTGCNQFCTPVVPR